jgi:hypothetical protein
VWWWTGRGLGLRDGDRVRGARDLGGAAGAGALGHVVLEGGRDDVVLLAAGRCVMAIRAACGAGTSWQKMSWKLSGAT